MALCDRLFIQMSLPGQNFQINENKVVGHPTGHFLINCYVYFYLFYIYRITILLKFYIILYLYLPCYEHSLSTRLICSDSVRFVKVLLGQTTTPGTTFPTLCDKCVGSLTFPTNQYREDAGDGAYGLSSLSKKSRMSNCLQISQQRQHILLSYFKTLSVGPVWVLNPDLPHSSPALIHMTCNSLDFHVFLSREFPT